MSSRRPTTQAGHFVYESAEQRVVFASGRGRETVTDEVERRGARRLLLVAAASEAAMAEELTHDVGVAGQFTDVRQHVPAGCAEAATRAARTADADLLLSVGGGSTTGTAKAVARATGLPILAVPTTYAGSEATPVWGLTVDGRKTTGTDWSVLPRVVIYDAVLTRSLPVALSISSGLNALAHGVDAWWAPRQNPISSALATEAVRTLATGLVGVVADPQDVGAREDLLYATYLSGVAFAAAGSGLHHKICHVLGGAWDLNHADTHAIILPHVAGLNLPAVPDAQRRLLTALADDGASAGSGTARDPLGALVALYTRLDAPRALRDLGLQERDLDRASALILDQVPPGNPRPVTWAALRGMLERAWAGEPAQLVPYDQ